MENQNSVSAPAEVYAVASQGKRFLNYFVDYIFFIVFSFVVGIIIGLAGFTYVLEGINNVVLSLVLLVVYYAVSEFMWQKSPAKFITKTKVVSTDGTEPTFGQIMGRTLARFIPFEPFSFLGKVPVGWHDSLPETLVVPAHYTPEDVKKIDLNTPQKSKTSVIGIIVAVLIGLAVFGIIAAIMLASLSTAREKAREAQQEVVN